MVKVTVSADKEMPDELGFKRCISKIMPPVKTYRRASFN